MVAISPGLVPEAAVVEMTTGLDLAQLAGRRRAARHAAAPRAPRARLPGARCAPTSPAGAAGRLALLRLPTGPCVRVDTGVAEGDELRAGDSMLATIIAWGTGRAEALARLRRALAETLVVVEGGTTNHGFLLDARRAPRGARRRADTS